MNHHATCWLTLTDIIHHTADKCLDSHWIKHKKNKFTCWPTRSSSGKMDGTVSVVNIIYIVFSILQYFLAKPRLFMCKQNKTKLMKAHHFSFLISHFYLCKWKQNTSLPSFFEDNLKICSYTWLLLFALTLNPHPTPFGQTGSPSSGADLTDTLAEREHIPAARS